MVYQVMFANKNDRLSNLKLVCVDVIPQRSLTKTIDRLENIIDSFVRLMYTEMRVADFFTSRFDTFGVF